MGLSPIEISGAMSRVTDFAVLKQQDDQKAVVNQLNYTGTVEKQAEDRSNTVERGNNADNNQKKFDARDKGSNEYAGDGGRQKQGKNESVGDGLVRPKGLNQSSFDIRI